MGKIVFAEVLDRRGSIRERVRVDSFPVTVGRSYTNALVIEDRFVSEEHLRLSLDSDGSIIVEDLNTLNGTRLSRSGESVGRHRVPAGSEVVLRIGETILRLRGDDFSVGPATSSRAGFGSFDRYIGKTMMALLVFVIGFGLNVLGFAQEISKKVIWSDLTGMALLLLIAFALWTGFWSFLNRLVVHASRFVTHLGIAGIASIAFLMLLIAKEYFEFVFSAWAAAELLALVGFGLIFSLLLYGHLSVMSEFTGRKRMLASVLISAGIVSIILLFNYTNRKEFSNELRFSSVIKPVGRQWVRAVSPDEFFGGLGNLKTKIDAMAKGDPKKKAIEGNP